MVMVESLRQLISMELIPAGSLREQAAHPLNSFPLKCSARASQATAISSTRPSGKVTLNLTIIGLAGLTYSIFGVVAPVQPKRTVAMGAGAATMEEKTTFLPEVAEVTSALGASMAAQLRVFVASLV